MLRLLRRVDRVVHNAWWGKQIVSAGRHMRGRGRRLSEPSDDLADLQGQRTEKFLKAIHATLHLCTSGQEPLVHNAIGPQLLLDHLLESSDMLEKLWHLTGLRVQKLAEQVRVVVDRPRHGCKLALQPIHLIIPLGCSDRTTGL